MVVLLARLSKSAFSRGHGKFSVQSRFVFAALREIFFFNAFLGAATPLSRFHLNAWIQMRRANLRAHKYG
jgi:hypothetical protein